LANIIFAGMGQVGYNLALALSKEGHNLTIIEIDTEVTSVQESVDALVINGNAASLDILELAQPKNADLFIAVTGSDEVNIVACTFAKSMDCRTIARINNVDFIDQAVSLNRFNVLGIDIAICPELVAAIQMTNVIVSSALLNSRKFAKGKVHVLETKIKKRSAVINEKIMDIDLPPDCNIGTIFRGTEILVPTGKDRFLENDCAQVIIGDLKNLPRIQELFGKEVKRLTGKHKVQKIMLFGASGIGIRLAKMLQERGMSVVMLESDRQKCLYVSERLPKTTVLKGSGIDLETLENEGIDDVDIYIAATEKEEENILSGMLAKQGGAKTVMALVESLEIKDRLENVGIDMIISPNSVMVSTILRHAHTKDLKNLVVSNRGEAQIIELKVSKKSTLVGKKIQEVSEFKRNALIGAVVRKDEVLVPRGDFVLKANDRLLIFTKKPMIRKLTRLLKKG